MPENNHANSSNAGKEPPPRPWPRARDAGFGIGYRVPTGALQFAKIGTWNQKQLAKAPENKAVSSIKRCHKVPPVPIALTPAQKLPEHAIFAPECP
jgi:hypothetical protein